MLISVLAVALMSILGATAKWVTLDWLHPAVVFALLWIVACGLPIVVAPEYISSASGALWILLNVSLVVAGGIMGSGSAKHRWRRHPEQKRGGASGRLLSNRMLRTAVVACLGCAGLYIVLWFRMQGFNVAQVGNLEDAARIANKMSVQRYSAAGQATTPLIQVLLSVCLLGPLLGGTLFVQRRRLLDTALALSTMSPGLALFVLQSTRTSVLYSLVMWMAGYMSTRVYCGMKGTRVSSRALGVGMLCAFSLLLLTARG